MLHPVGCSITMLMAQHITRQFPLPFKGVLSSPAVRSTESTRIFIATAMMYHPEWKRPEVGTHLELSSWGSERQLDIIKQARDATKAHIAEHGGTVVEAAFALPVCREALAISAHDGQQALFQLIPYDTAPGVYVLSGIHSPQIDALGLLMAGAASISNKAGYTKENVDAYLGGFSRQCEGWIIVRDLETKSRHVIPLKYTNPIQQFIPSAMVDAHMDQQRYQQQLVKAGLIASANASN